MRATLVNVAETAAGIGSCIHEDRDRYFDLYHRVADAWSGFPGIWKFIGDVAVEIEKQRKTDDEWIEMCMCAATLICDIENPRTRPSTIARRAIKKAMKQVSPSRRRKRNL